MIRVRQPIHRTTKVILGIVSVISLMLLYTGLSMYQDSINPTQTIMPSLLEIGKATIEIATPHKTTGDIWLWEDFVATASRLAYGLSIASVVAVIVGVSMGSYPVVEAFFRWPVTFLGQIPATAMLAVFLILARVTDLPLSPMMVCFGILPSMILTIYLAAKYDIHDEQCYKAYTLGASNLEIICNVVVPQILPRILDAIRLSIGLALVLLVAVEWANEHVGFGYRLRVIGNRMKMDVVYNYLIFLGIFGWLLGWGMLALRNWLSPWFEAKR